MQKILFLLFLLLPLVAAQSQAAESHIAVNSEATATQVIADDLKFLRTLKFGKTSELHKKFFGSSDGAGIAKYFTDRIQSVRFVADADKGVLAFASPGVSFMTVHPLLFNPRISRLERIATLLHETRHVDGVMHEWCERNGTFRVFGHSYVLESLAKAPTEACDADELGAYGLQYIFLRSIVNSCLNCTAEMKTMAMISSDYQAASRMLDPTAAERLITGANLDPRKAFSEMDRVLKNKIGSGLRYDEWVAKCRKEQSCFK
jgi:hypothetical protein